MRIFIASCPRGELTEVLLKNPKVRELKLLSGFANWGWFRALKNSDLNCNLLESACLPSLIVLDSARSKFAWPGPSTIPVPLFPNAVAMPSTPTAGGEVKQDALK